jgi:hypothetical protein
MVSRAAFSQEVLAELGWLTIVYSGLEDLLVTFIGQLRNPDDQEPARDVAARMGSKEKRDTLQRLCLQRYPQAAPELLAAMATALKACADAGSARNDLVHGLADYDSGVVFMTRPGKPPKPIALDDVKAVNALVFDAFRQTVNAFAPLWNLTMGQFE